MLGFNGVWEFLELLSFYLIYLVVLGGFERFWEIDRFWELVCGGWDVGNRVWLKIIGLC